MKTEGLNILMVTPHFPYPLIGGERIKLFNLIRHISQKNNVFVTSLDRGYEVKPEFINVVKSMCKETNVYKINKISSFLYALFFSVFRNPLEVEYFRHPKLNKKIDAIIKTHEIDLILNFFIRTAEHVRNYKIKKILIAEDCRSLYQKRTSQFGNNFRQRIIRSFDSKKIEKYESEIMNYFDRTTVVTEQDYNQMKLLNPGAIIKIISQGVDSDIFCQGNKNQIRKDILFLGKLDVWTNILMINKIVKELFPIIKKSNPEVKFNIVGANPTKEISNFINDSIIIHENPENIVDFYQQSAVFLHPHSGGSGIQNKVLEAMSAECPVVTSESGANGIKITNSENGFIAKTNEEFVKFTCDLLNDPNLRMKIGKNSRNYVQTNNSWKSIFFEWDKMIEEL